MLGDDEILVETAFRTFLVRVQRDGAVGPSTWRAFFDRYDESCVATRARRASSRRLWTKRSRWQWLKRAPAIRPRPSCSDEMRCRSTSCGAGPRMALLCAEPAIEQAHPGAAALRAPFPPLDVFEKKPNFQPFRQASQLPTPSRSFTRGPRSPISVKDASVTRVFLS